MKLWTTNHKQARKNLTAFDGIVNEYVIYYALTKSDLSSLVIQLNKLKILHLYTHT